MSTFKPTVKDTPIEEIFEKFKKKEENLFDDNDLVITPTITAIHPSFEDSSSFNQQSILETYETVYLARHLFNFYQLDFNFHVKHFIPLIRECPGIEIIRPLTKYKIIIAIGELFNKEEVLTKIRKSSNSMNLGKLKEKGLI